MMQVRMRGEKNWYRPDRDLVHFLPRLIKYTLAKVFGETTNERAGSLAVELGKLFVSCSQREQTPEQLKTTLAEIRTAHVEEYTDFANQMLFELLLKYNEFARDMLPEDDETGTIRPVGSVEKPV